MKAAQATGPGPRRGDGMPARRAAWLTALGLLFAAAPLQAAPCPDLSPDEALALLNTERARGAVCAAAAPPLDWHPQLARAALRQAQWMALGGPLQHQGPEGEGLRERVQREAATARAAPFGRLVENLARGQRSLPEALTAWRDSAAHCANLFDARVSHAGLACSVGADRRPVWVLVLGRP